MSREAKKIMMERFGKDTVIALATIEKEVPYVRYVNAYYENGAFYIITYALSNKNQTYRKQSCCCNSWWVVYGTWKGAAIWAILEKKRIVWLLKKLKNVFAEWIDNGHTDFNDENTIILRVELTDGLLLSHGTRYEF